MVPHAVCKGVEAGGPVDENEEDVGGGISNDIVGEVGVGRKRHDDEM